MAINAGSIVASLDLDTGKFSTKLAAAQASADGFVGKLKGYGGAFEDLGKGLTLGVTTPITGLGVASGKMAIDFESAFAGVRKTVDASEGDFQRLETSIRDMSKEIPASATAISEVAEAAGQLGIETDNILGFTRVMIDLGESTNMSADEAATSLARLANITGMSQTDFDRLGSTIVDLGNNLATTEGEIVAMGLRLAGAGSQIGLTEAQIMSFAGALSSVGIEAEAGGSAFSKVMIDMQLAVETNSERLKEFADVAGMSADEFSKAFREDAAGAIITFIQGLGNAEEKGLSAIKVLDDMGISEVRLRDALLRAGGAADVFTNSLELGTNAWEENTALTKEAEQRYKTTASQIEIAKNHLKDAGITAGEIVVPMFVSMAEKVKDVSNWFSNLNPETQETIVKMAGLAAAVGPVLVVGGKMASGLGSIIGLFGKFGAGAKAAAGGAKLLGGATGLGSVVATGTKASGVIASLGGAAGTGGILGGLTSGLGASLAAINPWVIGIGAAAAGGYVLYKTLQEETIPAFEVFDETISESTKEALGSILDMEREATTSLKTLGLTGKEVSEEFYTDFTTNTNQMVDEVLSKLEEQKEEGLRVLSEYLGRQTEMSVEEQKEALRIATEKYDNEIQKVTEGKARIEEILLEAKEKNTSITDEERIEIEGILEDLKETSIEIMTESQAEQERILENLKNNADRITAEMMLEVIKNSREQKEKTIAEAEEQYEKTLDAAERLKKDGTAESKELADNMIAQAKRQKEDTIAEAEEMHQKVLSELESQGSDIYRQIDTDNERIKSKWDELKDWFARNPIIRKIEEIRETVREDYGAGAGTGWRNLGRNAHGTNYWSGGLSWVGEQGPEIVELPKGSKVYSNQQSMDLLANDTNVAPINLEVPVILDGREIAKATVEFTAQELKQLQDRKRRGR